MNWICTQGKAEFTNNEIRFKGGVVIYETIQQANAARILSDFEFMEGTIRFEVKLLTPEQKARELINQKKLNNFFGLLINNEEFSDGEKLTQIGISDANYMFEIKEWNRTTWNYLKLAGNGENLEYDASYKIEVNVKGSNISMKVNNVLVANINLKSVVNSYIGFSFYGPSEVIVSNIEVSSKIPEVFVVMQFSDEFDVLYHDVIKKVCKDNNLSAVRADDIYTTNMIITDIISKINKSRIIIADITPENRNVHYEVGYAHAIGKPTILLAEKGTKLPFDLSPFRVIFYENSIRGKDIVQNDLEKHIKAIMEMQ